MVLQEHHGVGGTLDSTELTPNHALFLSFLFPFMVGSRSACRAGRSSSITRLLSTCTGETPGSQPGMDPEGCCLPKPAGVLCAVGVVHPASKTPGDTLRAKTLEPSHGTGKWLVALKEHPKYTLSMSRPWGHGVSHREKQTEHT